MSLLGEICFIQLEKRAQEFEPETVILTTWRNSCKLPRSIPSVPLSNWSLVNVW